MKQESTAKYILRLTLTLLIIAATVAALLAVVNQFTLPIIQAAQLEKTQKAIQAVLPGGYDTEITDFTDESGLVSKVYKGQSGYAVEVKPVGFNGEITLMVGIDHEGKALGISVVSQAETAGLGAVIADGGEKGQSFRNQFAGMEGLLAVKKDGGEVEAVSGATISSRAVVKGVNAALDCVKSIIG